tara:strand:+ start:148 stop:456 length:309 start_codon:yes stop_codon:yes gene_type:complete
VVEEVEEEIVPNLLLKKLELQEDQEEVVFLADLDALVQLVLEIIPLQLPLKEVMEELVVLQTILIIMEAVVVELVLLVQLEHLPQEVVQVVLVKQIQLQEVQ